MQNQTNQDEITPQFKIETRVSYVAREQGIEVPLGNYYSSRWAPYEFVEGDDGSLVLSPGELIDWLANATSFGCSFMSSVEEAEQAVTQTIERCRSLAEAVRRGRNQM